MERPRSALPSCRLKLHHLLAHKGAADAAAHASAGGAIAVVAPAPARPLVPTQRHSEDGRQGISVVEDARDALGPVAEGRVHGHVDIGVLRSDAAVQLDARLDSLGQNDGGQNFRLGRLCPARG